jgi:SAM-dependent methyltransferase
MRQQKPGQGSKKAAACRIRLVLRLAGDQKRFKPGSTTRQTRPHQPARSQIIDLMDERTVAIYEDVAVQWQQSRGEASDDLGRLCRLQAGGGLVIDLGCGPGRYLSQLAAPVIGLDVSTSMLALAKVQGHPVVHADLELLPFADNAFAGAFARHSYLHVPKARAQGGTDLLATARR